MGNASIKIGKPYTIQITTTDPDQDQIHYMIDWGSEKTDWIGPYESGETITKSHAFSFRGNHTIKVKSKDTTEAESNWGTLTFTISNQPHQIPPTQFPLLNFIRKYFSHTILYDYLNCLF